MAQIHSKTILVFLLIIGLVEPLMMARNVGTYALLHGVFSAERQSDPVETLISHNPAQYAWMTSHCDQPEKGKGLVQAFSHDQSPYDSAYCQLHGLEAKTRCTGTRMDDPPVKANHSHNDLKERELSAAIVKTLSAVVLTYQRE